MTQPSQPRIRESDGAVYIDGIGYVHELFTHGSKEAAQQAALNRQRATPSLTASTRK